MIVWEFQINWLFEMASMHSAGGIYFAHIVEFWKELKMRILYINNDGAGFADYVGVAENTTVEQFFAIKMQGCQAIDYLIRVNRQPVAKDYILQDSDRVTMTPTKIEGAA